ncbi:ATP-binding protein [Mycobacterium sp. URHB0044]|uniref:ATP-binding protein n=1 Tax=Mycobacterium sp. URHB0044 TaxID=1380386 RepID=UPI001E39EC5D|nr:AAA family ATPase [Mycobacterium sp. URHB0044]
MAVTALALPPGVLSIHALPADHHDGPWDHILTPPGVKERLLNHALLTLLHGPALATLAGLPHGLIILAGPPGTGKTTLARGLAQMAARAVAKRGATTYVEIDPHAFPSEMLGESQRNIALLMTDTIPELAARRPHTVVLIDEVESFAVRRSAASFGSNPVDVHRATDALLAGIDAVAADLPRVLFVATTNFVEAVDEAFLSRADLVVQLTLPDAATIAQILRHSLLELSVLWPAVGSLADDDGLHAKLATACAGWDGRRVRKLVLSALALRQATTRDPNLLTADDLLAAVDAMAPEDTGVTG